MRNLIGLRSTNKPHLGNYFGSIANLNNNNENFLLIANLHSLTEKTSYEDVYLLASLLYNYSGYLYIQSDFLETPYLMWLLNSICPIGLLQRMTQYKSQTGDFSSSYLTYPLLMAADILITNANNIIVGADQKQHIEFTRDLAQIANRKFHKNVFTMPNYVESKAPKILNLQSDDKMSKSKGEEKGVIFLFDSKDIIASKIKIAKTDSERMPINIVEIEHSRPAVYNLCLIYSLVTSKTFSEIEKDFGGSGYQVFKECLTYALIEFLENLQNQCNNISKSDIDKKINQDKEFISHLFSENLKKIKPFFNL